MSSPLVGVFGVVFLLVLIAMRMPIGFAMALTGFLGTFYIAGGKIATSVLAMVPFGTFAEYSLVTIPTFLLMGQLALVSGISGDLFAAAFKWIGKAPGGLGITTIGACAIFSAACGSSAATAASMAAVALPEMKRFGYSNKFATGVVVAGGTLGILIPPSIPFVVYGMMTQQSVGQLFMAGVIPGLLLASLYALVAFVWAKANPDAAPPSSVSFSLREKIGSLWSIWGMMLLIALVLGGIYFGWFTPTEAGALGATGAFLLTVVRRRLDRTSLTAAIRDTASTTGMIFLILAGAMMFQHFMAISNMSRSLAEYIAGLSVSPYIILACILVLLVLFGCFMESLSMMLLSLPILFPIITKLGFDPIWFGVIMVIMIETGVITPPVGTNVFIVAGVAKDVRLEEIFRGSMPYLIALFVSVVIMIVFPQVSLFLPGLMKR